MAPPSNELNDAELAELDTILARSDGGKIANSEALDGFFAALACCPDLIMPSEYLPVIQAGEMEDGGLTFDDMAETERFMALVSQHWNHVNHQLNECDVYLPLILANEQGVYAGNGWAKGFLTGTHLRHEIWSDLINDEERAGSILPIMMLAYENDPDPSLRPFDEPIDDEKREELMIAAAAGVMRIHAGFLTERGSYLEEPETFVRSGPKVGRNAPCPCGSGKKFKRCCGGNPMLH